MPLVTTAEKAFKTQVYRPWGGGSAGFRTSFLARPGSSDKMQAIGSEAL
jgi:hypothetical protein